VTAPALYRNRDGFTVEPDALGTRADRIDSLADRLHRAASGPLLLDQGAFGLVGGAVFGTTAVQAAGLGTSAVDNLGLVVSEVAEDLRDCRNAYVDRDGAIADRFVAIAAMCHGAGSR
jgi:hypothetical protein